MWVRLLRSFPGKEAYDIFVRGPRWFWGGRVLKTYVNKHVCAFSVLCLGRDIPGFGCSLGAFGKLHALFLLPQPENILRFCFATLGIDFILPGYF